MSAHTLTQARLKELLDYDPETGVFTWKKVTSFRVKVGSEAGTRQLRGYRMITVDRCRYPASHLAFLFVEGRWPSYPVNYRDEDQSNSQWANLYEARPIGAGGGEGLTQARLLELVYYCPETGEFVWKSPTVRWINKGDKAGISGGTDYSTVGIDRRRYLAHRIAFLYMVGRWPIFVDHINGDRTDNRWVNLREVVSRVEQGRNLPRSKANTSGQTGVHWSKQSKKWVARIMVEYKTKHIGYFSALEDAVAARKAAEVKYGFHPNHGRDTVR